MSQYYFHLSSGSETRDEEGTELATLEEARRYAVRMIAEVLCNSPERYWQHEVYGVTVSDGAGLTLFTVDMISTDSAAMGRRGRASS